MPVKKTIKPMSNSDSKYRDGSFKQLREWFINYADWYMFLPGSMTKGKGKRKPTKWSQRVSRLKNQNLFPSSDVVAKMLKEQGFEIRVQVIPPEAKYITIRESSKWLRYLGAGKIFKVSKLLKNPKDGLYYYELRTEENPGMGGANIQPSIALNIPCIDCIIVDEGNALRSLPHKT